MVIKYLGFRVVNVEMIDSGREISISARSTAIASIAGGMNNHYSSTYEIDYLPMSYAKIIVQKKYQEKRMISYDRRKNVATRTSFIDSLNNCSYLIHTESRDFFSALYYIRSNLSESGGVLWLDANRLIWRVDYEIISKERIGSFLGKKETLLVKIDFTKISDQQAERTDMLTNNLVSEENSLYIWFSNDNEKLPLKAKFKMKPFSVIWKMTGYEK